VLAYTLPVYDISNKFGTCGFNMRVIQRAATCAYSFVAMNWDQVTAFVYLARGGDAGAHERRRRPGAQIAAGDEEGYS
jgi:hypothetical protein